MPSSNLFVIQILLSNLVSFFFPNRSDRLWRVCYKYFNLPVQKRAEFIMSSIRQLCGFFPLSTGMQIFWSGEELWVDSKNFILLDKTWGVSLKASALEKWWYCVLCCLCAELKWNFFITFTWNNGTCYFRHSQNLIHLPVCLGSRKISWWTWTPTVLSSVPFKCSNCRT